MVAALFNPKTSTHTHTHTQLQTANDWYGVCQAAGARAHALSLSFTYVSVQLSFVTWFIAIHVDVCKQSSEQAGGRVSGRAKPITYTIHIYTWSMPTNMWNEIVDLISRCIHIFCDNNSIFYTISCFCHRFRFIWEFFFAARVCRMYVCPPFYNRKST